MRIRIPVVVLLGLSCAALSCATVPHEKQGDAIAFVDAISSLSSTSQERTRMLAARPYRTVDLTTAHALLTSDNLVDMLDLAAPEDWPEAARSAWASGAAACRARAVRPPWRESAEAKACARELGPSVLHRLARARGAKAIVTVGVDEIAANKVSVTIVTPGASDARALLGDDAQVGAMMDELVLRNGGHEVSGQPQGAPSLPSLPAPEDDITDRASPRPFDVMAVAGCERPMPVALRVAPAGARMSTLIERAWSRMSEAKRTAPESSCELRAWWAGAAGADAGSSAPLEGSLDCAGLPVVKISTARRQGHTLDDDAAYLAKQLVDQLAFDACNGR